MDGAKLDEKTVAEHMLYLTAFKEVDNVFSYGFSVQFRSVHHATSCP